MKRCATPCNTILISKHNWGWKHASACSQGMAESFDSGLYALLSLSSGVWRWNPCVNLFLSHQSEHANMGLSALLALLYGVFPLALQGDENTMAESLLSHRRG